MYDLTFFLSEGIKKKLVKTHLKCQQNPYYQENNRVGDESYYFPQIGLSF